MRGEGVAMDGDRCGGCGAPVDLTGLEPRLMPHLVYCVVCGAVTEIRI